MKYFLHWPFLNFLNLDKDFLWLFSMQVSDVNLWFLKFQQAQEVEPILLFIIIGQIYFITGRKPQMHQLLMTRMVMILNDHKEEQIIMPCGLSMVFHFSIESLCSNRQTGWDNKFTPYCMAHFFTLHIVISCSCSWLSWATEIFWCN